MHDEHPEFVIFNPNECDACDQTGANENDMGVNSFEKVADTNHEPETSSKSTNIPEFNKV